MSVFAHTLIGVRKNFGGVVSVRKDLNRSWWDLGVVLICSRLGLIWLRGLLFMPSVLMSTRAVLVYSLKGSASSQLWPRKIRIRSLLMMAKSLKSCQFRLWLLDLLTNPRGRHLGMLISNSTSNFKLLSL